MSIFDSLRRLFGGETSKGSGDPGAEMISCEEALSVLYEYLDGELEDVSGERVKAHFDVCTRCYPHLRFEESFREAVHRAAEGAQAPADLKARLMDALAEAGGS